MNTRTRPAVGPRARTSTEVRSTSPRLFRLDGGYIVLDEAAARRGGEGLSAIASEWREYHVTAITGAPAGATTDDFSELGRAAQAFDRIVICESCGAGCAAGSGAAALFARAVRSAGRTECYAVGDAHRALRHCIDSMVPGSVVAYCCGDIETAARILAEYGAVEIDRRGRGAEPTTGTHVALSGTTGELTAAHI
jgi:hypothetical protein